MSKKTASEVCMQVMEDFGKWEPDGIFIVHTDEGGNIQLTHNMAPTQAMGFALWAIAVTLKRMLQD